MSGSRVNGVVPNLINGVSQQAPQYRLPSQCEIQDNAISSVVFGVAKRPPSEHVAKISSSQLNGAFAHTIERDETEQYEVIVSNGNLQVFDLLDSGREIAVAFPDGRDYLQSATPKTSFRMSTVADYTFVLNRDVTVRMDATEEMETERNEAVAYIKKGIVETTYRVMVDGQWVQYKTPAPNNTVSTMTSGVDQEVEIDPSLWTWTQCYDWLNTNNGQNLIPSGSNPYTWTPAQCGYFLYRSTTISIETDPIFVIQLLDMSDADLRAQQAVLPPQHPNYNPPEIRQRATECLTIKENMRAVVVSLSQSLANAGATISSSTTTQSGTQPSTEDIAQALANGLIAYLGSAYSIETLGSSIRIRRANNADFQFAVTDSWGNEAMIGIKREVQKFTDLPARCWDGFRVRVVGENPAKEDDYYLEYSSDDFYKNGVWRETRGWNQQNRFNPSTMPHTLIREADGTFTFERASWKERKCGDDDSVPVPTFVDRKIEDVFFYRNRLGFAVDENIVLSGAGAFFQFWPDTATSVLATDPIDAASTHEKVSMLKHAVVFQENLILFSPVTQFQAGAGGASYLAPDTLKIDPTTVQPCSPICRPVGVSQAVYFVADHGDYSVLQEYFVDSDTLASVAPEVTTHVPEYVPRGVFKMTAAASDGIIFLVSEETPNIIYGYRYHWVGEEKMQSAWFRWIFDERTDNILNISAIGSVLHLVVQRTDGVYLESININGKGEEKELGYRVHLDRKVRVHGQYDAATDRTSWLLPYRVNSYNLAAVCGPEFPDGMAGSLLDISSMSGNRIFASGNYPFDVIVGQQYEMLFRFSTQYFRESRDPGASVIVEGRLQLLNFTLSYQDSGYFQVRVQSRGREPKIVTHAGIVGALDYRTGTPFVSSGNLKAGVYARSDRATIDVVNSLHMPCKFQSAEWVGVFEMDARRT